VGRRVLGAVDAGERGRDEDDAPRLPDRQRGAGVGADEGLLDCDGIRIPLLHLVLHALEDRQQPELRPFPRRRVPAPEVECPESAVSLVDDRVAA
jgi:hypothetical protein